MKLWYLRNTDGPSYDEAHEFVVRAENEHAARHLASLQHGDEGASLWLRTWQSSCIELKQRGPAEVIMRDFMRG